MDIWSILASAAGFLRDFVDARKSDDKLTIGELIKIAVDTAKKAGFETDKAFFTMDGAKLEGFANMLGLAMQDKAISIDEAVDLAGMYKYALPLKLVARIAGLDTSAPLIALDGHMVSEMVGKLRSAMADGTITIDEAADIVRAGWGETDITPPIG